MKFSVREDIAAPIDHVFEAVSDFVAFERSALRRGIDVQRKGRLKHDGARIGWIVKVDYRGRARELSTELVKVDPPHGMDFVVDGASINGRGGVELVQLSRKRTRLMLSLELVPLSFMGRLMLQSARLVKPRMMARFEERVGEFAAGIESRYTG